MLFSSAQPIFQMYAIMYCSIVSIHYNTLFHLHGLTIIIAVFLPCSCLWYFNNNNNWNREAKIKFYIFKQNFVYFPADSMITSTQQVGNAAMTTRSQSEKGKKKGYGSGGIKVTIRENFHVFVFQSCQQREER